MRNAFCALFYGAALLLGVEARAQARPYQLPIAVDAHTPFAIVVVNDFQYRNADVVIVRRAAEAPHDVIMVKKAKLRPDRLAEAVHSLTVARASSGDVPTADMLIRVKSSAVKRRHQDEAAGWITRLQSGRIFSVPGIGNVPMVQAYLPNQRRAQ